MPRPSNPRPATPIGSAFIKAQRRLTLTWKTASRNRFGVARIGVNPAGRTLLMVALGYFVRAFVPCASKATMCQCGDDGQTKTRTDGSGSFPDRTGMRHVRP